MALVIITSHAVVDDACAPVRHSAWDMGALTEVPETTTKLKLRGLSLLFFTTSPNEKYEGEAGQKALTASKGQDLGSSPHL